MKEAIDTTAERREKQIKHNTKHGITPTTIIKDISGGVIDMLRKNKTKSSTTGKEAREYLDEMTPKAIDAKIEELKRKMREASKNLEFEVAAQMRDEIKELTKMRLML
jgi:excinuclease ABC subunit B